MIASAKSSHRTKPSNETLNFEVLDHALKFLKVTFEAALKLIVESLCSEISLHFCDDCKKFREGECKHNQPVDNSDASKVRQRLSMQNSDVFDEHHVSANLPAPSAAVMKSSMTQANEGDLFPTAAAKAAATAAATAVATAAATAAATASATASATAIECSSEAGGNDAISATAIECNSETSGDDASGSSNLAAFTFFVWTIAVSMIVFFVSTMSKQAAAPMLLAVQAATKQMSATVSVNAEPYPFTASLLHGHSFVRESMWWWIPLARKKFWWWIASSGLPYHNDAFQYHMEMVLMCRFLFMTEYFVMRECGNIQRLFTSASDSVFRFSCSCARTARMLGFLFSNFGFALSDPTLSDSLGTLEVL